ncbi:MAG: glutamate formimidoyltransferase [Flavobacteriales bacterium]|nr:glutamate formimidoyltransferase [Flavobacteriales bacterium]NNK80389.1 glutamate formimidoyltransferase [Flavobacteriales bacterium]
MKSIIECVPNISEGRDKSKIEAIAAAASSVEGVKLLDIDPGASTNRTVITFVGEPEAVCEAAFQLIKKASELIDMSKHTGEHPRMGATDVCPLIPISGITMEETTRYAKKLGERVGKELNIPVYLYENAASNDKRRNLAYCRTGEYEGLDKLSTEEFAPDHGPDKFEGSVKQTGATAISARDFLVAYNINLNTTSTRRANAIAFDIREAGRVKKTKGITGEVITDDNGEPLRIPGSLKAVKGIGWYIEEYGVAQLSLNLTNISITPVHVAFDEACRAAQDRGIRVTGSELVGLIPKQAMLDAADHFLKKQQRSLGISEEEKMKIAVKSLGLDDLKPFDPRKRVIEYLIEDSTQKKLIDMDLKSFAQETARESPTPGGGSISAYVGALGVSLGVMVANLSSHKRGWDDRWEEFSEWAVKGQEYLTKLLYLVDEDTNSFNKIMEAFQLPKGTEEEKSARKQAIQDATRYAIEIPYEVMKTCYESMEVMKAMVEKGNPNSITDGAVGALCARAGVIGAFMNVRINCAEYKDEVFVKDVIAKGNDIQKKAMQLEDEIIKMVGSNL